MIVIQGRKGWVQGAERSPSEPCGKHIGWIFAKLLVLLLNGATFCTAGEYMYMYMYGHGSLIALTEKDDTLLQRT